MAESSTFAKAQREKSSWTSTAFMVEAVVLLFFLIASMAAFTQLFCMAADTSVKASRLASATTIAQNAAEEFSADPVSVAKGNQIGAGVATGAASGEASNEAGELQVSCDVTKKKQSAGTLYTAHIVVSDSDSEVYTLEADRYVEGGDQ